MFIEQEEEHQQALDDTGFWGREAAGCLFFAEDTKRFLIAHRSDEVEHPLTWGTWGGAIDVGDTPMTTVIREVKEETNYGGPIHLEKLWVFKHESGFKYYNFLAIVPKEFTPTLNWESQDAKWFKNGDWPSPLHHGLADLIKHEQERFTRISQ